MIRIVTPHLDELRAALAKRRWSAAYDLIEPAAREGDADAVAVLLDVALEAPDLSTQVFLCLRLVDAPAAVAGLRLALAGELTNEGRAVACVSLALLGGGAAEEDVRRELTGAATAVVRTAALDGLCLTGGGTAWEEVRSILPGLVRSRPQIPSPVRTAIAYLIVHRGRYREREEALAALIARVRPKMTSDDAAWTAEAWPEGDGTAAAWLAHITSRIGPPR